MGEVRFKGTIVHTEGNFPKTGSKASDFELIKQDLSTVTLESFTGKRKVLNIFISLDTPVCSKSVHEFTKAISSFTDVALINISMDLPFAASRFCKIEGVSEAITLSAFRSTFSEMYGVKIAEGPLKGLCARAVLVLNKDNTILYSELVPEITQEPNYQAALQALK